MADTLALKAAPPPIARAPLACSLRRKEKVGRHGPVPFWAEVELVNLSDKLLTIEHELTELQYLDLVVHDSTGKVVSAHHYADRFSPFDKPKTLRLAPGEKFTAEVHLFATMPRDPVPPGVYSVQAIYEYNGFRAESEPVEVTVSG